jgi:hypothetical protein
MDKYYIVHDNGYYFVYRDIIKEGLKKYFDLNIIDDNAMVVQNTKSAVLKLFFNKKMDHELLMKVKKHLFDNLPYLKRVIFNNRNMVLYFKHNMKAMIIY